MKTMCKPYHVHFQGRSLLRNWGWTKHHLAKLLYIAGQLLSALTTQTTGVSPNKFNEIEYNGTEPFTTERKPTAFHLYTKCSDVTLTSTKPCHHIGSIIKREIKCINQQRQLECFKIYLLKQHTTLLKRSSKESNPQHLIWFWLDSWLSIKLLHNIANYFNDQILRRHYFINIVEKPKTETVNFFCQYKWSPFAGSRKQHS